MNQKTTLRLPIDMHEKIQRDAKKRGISMNALISSILHQHLSNHESPRIDQRSA